MTWDRVSVEATHWAPDMYMLPPGRMSTISKCQGEGWVLRHRGQGLLHRSTAPDEWKVLSSPKDEYVGQLHALGSLMLESLCFSVQNGMSAVKESDVILRGGCWLPTKP